MTTTDPLLDRLPADARTPELVAAVESWRRLEALHADIAENQAAATEAFDSAVADFDTEAVLAASQRLCALECAADLLPAPNLDQHQVDSAIRRVDSSIREALQPINLEVSLYSAENANWTWARTHSQLGAADRPGYCDDDLEAETLRSNASVVLDAAQRAYEAWRLQPDNVSTLVEGFEVLALIQRAAPKVEVANEAARKATAAHRAAGLTWEPSFVRQVPSFDPPKCPYPVEALRAL